MSKVSNRNQQTGMALFQVLLIVAIISVLLLIIIANSNATVSQAQRLQQQTEERLAMYSAQNFIDQQLLTNRWSAPADENETRQLPSLNFHGQAMTVQLPERVSYRSLAPEVVLKLQNLSSLLNINTTSQLLVDTMILRGIEPARAQLLLNNLRDYTQREYAVHLQTANDLLGVPEWTRADIDRIRDLVSAESGLFNPAHAPDALLPVLLRSGVAASISAMRASGDYDINAYSSLTDDYGNEVQSLFPGSEQRVTIEDPKSGLISQRELQFDTYGLTPLSPFSRAIFRRVSPYFYNEEWHDNNNE